ncbi:uncharacterized protein LOC106175700 [Trichonephila clavata]|uniref:Uncharacterized protein LOC106175700 n=1 Tax=Trichonephila clavata TaxID=2740835 RepID=A0A8X6JQZ2_TRICU|nr:uncharacterized protein LOC106175700 [Trichonephila clavata]
MKVINSLGEKNEEQTKSLMEKLEFCSNSMQNFNSKYTILKSFKANNRYIDPVEVLLGSRHEQKLSKDGIPQQILWKDTCQYISIAETMQHIISTNGFINLFQAYKLDKSTRDIALCCIQDGFNYYSNATFTAIDTITIELYVDDVEISNFNYGKCDSRCKPVPIKREKLSNLDGSNGQRCISNVILMRILPLLILDKVPYDNDFWNLYLLMLTIIDTLMATVISLRETYGLAKNIADHHKLFLILFPNRHLTPKMHFALHYPMIIRQLGPPVRFSHKRISSMDFVEKSSKSGKWKNICRTLKIHFPHLLLYLYYLLCQHPAEKKINIRETVKLKFPDIFAKLEKGDPTNDSILHKYRINRLLVQTYVEEYDCRPSTKNKLNLAKHIVNAFPVLKGSDGEGHEQWFSPGVRGAPVTGFIADRFKNFRSRNLSVVEKEELGIGRICKKTNENPEKYPGPEDSSVEFFLNQQWLKKNASPLEKIIQLMQETFEGRRFGIIKMPLVLFLIGLKFWIHMLNMLCSCPVASAKRLQEKWAKEIEVRPTSSQSLDHFIQFIPVGEGVDKFMREDDYLGRKETALVLAIGEKCKPQQVFLILKRTVWKLKQYF